MRDASYQLDQRHPSGAQARHRSQPSAVSATPATQNEGGCREVPRLPRKTKVHRTTKEPAQCHKCHACHAKRRSMSPSATQNEGEGPQVPCLRVRWCVTKLCVVTKLRERRWCGTGREGGGGTEAGRDTESKTRTPHTDVGKQMDNYY